VKKSFQIAAIGFLVVVSILVVAGALSPPIWRVEVRRTIAATPAQIHPLLVDLRAWQRWAGWNEAFDPEVTFSFAGPAVGVGASWSWRGPKMGRGTITITKADSEAGVWLDEAIESDEINAHGSITYTVIDAQQTMVTWRDEGRLPPIIGGLMRASVEAGLTTHFGVALDRLAAAASADGDGDGGGG
jgi:hypothetical protein